MQSDTGIWELSTLIHIYQETRKQPKLFEETSMGTGSQQPFMKLY